MPGIRIQYLQGTVWGLTPEQIKTRIIEGVNKHTGQPMMRELITKLTAPLTAAEQDMTPKKLDVGPATYTDTEENLHKLFLEKRYTDFLPVVLPTKERVDAMLAQTSHDPDAFLGRMHPGSVAGETWTYTVRHAAIAAVMAGAKPEYLPVILAIGSTGQTAVNVSDNGFAAGAIINGKIRDEIGMNYDLGAIGPYAHANTTIGRAWSLLSINGGNCGKVGTTYHGTVGNPANLINVIIAENEEESPWEPFSVRKGFKKDENVVTLLNGWGILSARNWQVTDWSATPTYSKTVQDIYRLQNPGLFGTFVVLSPPIADFIVSEGYNTLEKFNEFVTAPDPNAKPKMPAGAAKPAGDAAAKAKAGAAKPGAGGPGAGGPGGAPKPKVAPNATSGAFGVVVTGGRNNNYWMIGGLAPGTSVSIDAWR
ncbi:MAG: hypothetical protein LBJ21_03595 [Acidobacteriota bacterium]|nr:hypothetical protein [Acidobacteriota bacterium]